MCGWIGKGILARAPLRPNSAWKALGVIGPSRSVMKTCEDGPCSRCRRRRARISSPCIGWTLGEPFLGPTNVQAARGQLDLKPSEIAQLGGPEAMAVADQDHGGVPVAVAARTSGCGHQALDLPPG